MYTVRILFCSLCIVIACCGWGNGSGVVGNGRGVKAGAEKVIAIAQKEIGVQESMENGGERVDQYNAYVGLKKVAWCASFVSWCHRQAGYPQPRTAWSPTLFPKERLVASSLLSASLSRGRRSEMSGLVFGVWFPSLNRVAHVGFVERIQGDFLQTIEGNTSPDGGREGTGVFRRIRHKRTIYQYANWLF